MAPSTPPPPSSERLAAFTIALTSSVVMSATTISSAVWPISAVSTVMRVTISPALGIDLGLEIDARARPDILIVSIEEAPRRTLAELTQQLEGFVIVAQLGRSRKPLSEPFQHDPVHVDAAILVRSGPVWQAPLVDQPVDKFDRAQFRQKRRIEGDLVDAAHDLARRGRDFLSHKRIDLNDQHVLGAGRAEERIDDRIAEIAAVPVRHAVDRDGAEYRGQTGRGHHRLGGNLLAREYVQAAGLHIGCGDENLPCVRAQTIEVDEALDEILERVDVEWIDVVGREIARPGGEPVERWRAFARQK